MAMIYFIGSRRGRSEDKYLFTSNLPTCNNSKIFDGIYNI